MTVGSVPPSAPVAASALSADDVPEVPAVDPPAALHATRTKDDARVMAARNPYFVIDSKIICSSS
jgi:hypothetical protein